MNITLFEEAELLKPLAALDPRARHLLKTLGKKAGDEFCAGVLGGKTGTGKIRGINSDGALELDFSLTEDAPARLPVEIAVGFVRPIQIKRILRELATFGVEKISITGTDLGEKSYRDTTLLKDGGAEAALIAGAVQGRDTVLPKLTVYENVASWLDSLDRRGKALVAADNISPEGMFSEFRSAQPAFIIAVGSERGWSDNERNNFKKAGFKRLSLGGRPLRTETAVIAAAVLAQSKLHASIHKC
ncbi:MAG: RsmE family RNA methyltransferase [Spirochaetaceae bacterium]|jgi:RsmE family RNA methyltransferase|nr:RsmE family RNA methyltransferase [Spirochaetaceae bacterium]